MTAFLSVGGLSFLNDRRLRSLSLVEARKLPYFARHFTGKICRIASLNAVVEALSSLKLCLLLFCSCGRKSSPCSLADRLRRNPGRS